MKSAGRVRSLSARFDRLFALTWALRLNDYWMHDNECYAEGGECETALNALAEAWKALLKKSDAELGIDAEFTRPGVAAMLDSFAATLSGIERGELTGYKFNWI